MREHLIKLSPNPGILKNIPEALWFCLVLSLALVVRIYWLLIFEKCYGIDAIHYLWISEHVSRGEWNLLPRLFTSPLLPLLAGLSSWVTGENLWTGRVICILGNTLAVGLAMLLVRRGFPERPALAWLTGLSLSFNDVWAGLSPYFLTDNLFYPEIIGLLLLFFYLSENPTILTGLAFGALWALTYLTRDVGLYCGGILFVVLIVSRLRITWNLTKSIIQGIKLIIPILSMLFIIGGLWVYWFYTSFGIISLGEGPRFYLSGTNAIKSNSDIACYQNGSLGPFHFRPYEMMEFTRAIRPGDERYPVSLSWKHLLDFNKNGERIWINIIYTLHEFKSISIILGLIGLILLILTGSFSHPMGLTLISSLLLLGLHIFAQVRDIRHIAWFFPWIYLGLAAVTVWFWDLIQTSFSNKFIRIGLSLVLIGLFCYNLLSPQYLKELPYRWSIRKLPQVHQLAADQIIKSHGFSAVISSREPEVAYRASGYWIALPNGTAEEMVTWLYLGGADYLFLQDGAPIPEQEKIFWADPVILQDKFPELKLVADFNLIESPAYGRRGRLYRFEPNPAKFEKYREQFPWAGTHPRVSGAWAPDLQRPACNQYENTISGKNF